jgi:hypothetical protein
MRQFRITSPALCGLISVMAGLLIGPAGCAKPAVEGPSKVTVTGTVQWDGKPLDLGDVLFIDTVGNDRRYAGIIKNGKFRFECTPGAKRVEVQAFRNGNVPVDKVSHDNGQYIPRQYNEVSTLVAEVTKSGENHFEFTLTP